MAAGLYFYAPKEENKYLERENWWFNKQQS